MKNGIIGINESCTTGIESCKGKEIKIPLSERIALWNMIQKRHSEIPDFGYTELRL